MGEPVESILAAIADNLTVYPVAYTKPSYLNSGTSWEALGNITIEDSIYKGKPSAITHEKEQKGLGATTWWREDDDTVVPTVVTSTE